MVVSLCSWRHEMHSPYDRGRIFSVDTEQWAAILTAVQVSELL